MSRRPLMAGNWKMNLNHLEAIAVTQKLAYSLEERDFDAVDVVIIPPFTDIRSVQTLVDGDRLRISYGAQDISPEKSGAFTGDISGSMLKKLDCSFVIVGHSERRAIHGESDELVNRKIRAVLDNEMTPIFCIGEELAIRESGNQVEYVLNQVRAGLKGLHKPDLKKIVFAYEPVW
ncbi:MAG: triosephosphate isomerase, partial [Actinobacteria bacterium]|nr:triosephosphate isomerase [Actinomycetota bacterium]